jgi:predicted ATP-grasp superfamily ATP-dependent carboligase
MDLNLRDTVVVAPADNLISLAVVRSLGRNGLRVVAISQREGIGASSRYATEVIRAEKGEAGLVDAVRTAIHQYHPSAVFALGELEITALNLHREELEQSAKLLFPDQRRFELALRKDKTLAIARGLGIDTPETILISGSEELHLCAEVRYPVVVKPRQQDVVDFKNVELGSEAELAGFFQHLPAFDNFYLVQEYCAGRGVGVEILMHEGKALLTFQHRRVREYPPDGGVSVCCEAMAPEAQLVRQSEELLRAMDWEGVAMVEYRRDERTGRTVLMEVNGRFWGSLPLAIHAGADFPYALYLASKGAFAPSRSPKTSVRARLLAGDSKWLYAVLKTGCLPRGRAILDYLWDIRPQVKSFVWCLDDLAPTWMFMKQHLCRIGAYFQR